MSGGYNLTINPGVLEVYCGPMKSGKTRELINRLDKLNYLPSCEFDLFKPAIDTRTDKVISRFGSLSYDCKLVNENYPDDIMNKMKRNTQLVAIDEAQFFEKGIERTVEDLLRADINVVVSGLDMDFRGESFGRMHNLMAMANKVTKLTGICDFYDCGGEATRTQRLIDGSPAPYDSETILIGDSTEGYECRCLKHHFVPMKKFDLSHVQKELFNEEDEKITQKELF
jgi:thymidine kinase